MTDKKAYIEKLEEQLRQWSTKIDELKVQANLAKAETRDEYDRQIKILRERQSTLRKKLDELREAGKDAWSELSVGADKAVDDMKDAFRKAFDRLGK